MKRSKIELTDQQKEDLEWLRNMPEDEIDTSDAPEILDWSGAVRGMFYQPAEHQINSPEDEDADAVSKGKAEAG